MLDIRNVTAVVALGNDNLPVPYFLDLNGRRRRLFQCFDEAASAGVVSKSASIRKSFEGTGAFDYIFRYLAEQGWH